MSSRHPKRKPWTFIHFIVAACLVTCMAPVAAQSYPIKPVRLIIPFPPGGGNDIVGRMVGTQLSERLGRQVVIDNRGGGGGVIGTEMAASSQPDGYTLLIVSATYTVNPWLYKLSFDPAKAFVPIAMIGSSPNLLVTPPSFPANSVKDLISAAKAKPGAFNYASGGVGSNPHLSAALFASLAGIKVVHVPFRGTGPMIIDVVGGQSQFCIGPLMAAAPHVKSGRLKALGVSSARRSTVLPNVPTITEAGVAGYESSNWWGVVAPAGTPREIVNRLHAETATVLALPETQKWFATEGATSAKLTPHEFGRHIVAELAKWGKVIKEFGIRPE